MLDTAAGKSAQARDMADAPRKASGRISRRIWLPSAIYNALPYFYLVAGISAFFTTMYISDWFWVLPHYLLFSAACVHLGIVIYRKRRAHAKDKS